MSFPSAHVSHPWGKQFYQRRLVSPLVLYDWQRGILVAFPQDWPALANALGAANQALRENPDHRAVSSSLVPYQHKVTADLIIE
jgi:hypothetical protein